MDTPFLRHSKVTEEIVLCMWTVHFCFLPLFALCSSGANYSTLTIGKMTVTCPPMVVAVLAEQEYLNNVKCVAAGLLLAQII